MQDGIVVLQKGARADRAWGAGHRGHGAFPQPRPISGPHRNGAILVIERDDDVRTLIAESLDAFGHPVVTVPSSEAARDALSSGEVVLLIADIATAADDIASLLGRARRTATSFRTIAMSGGLAALDREPSVAAAGADAIIRMPFRTGALLSEVRRLLPA